MELKKILHGHAITLLERKSTKAILSDAFHNDMPKINALMSAYDIGIVTTIRIFTNISQIYELFLYFQDYCDFLSMSHLKSAYLILPFGCFSS